MKIVESLEPRQLFAAVVVDQAHVGSIIDDDGSTITLHVEGPGSATLDNATGGFSLNLTNSNKTTALSLDVIGGDGFAVARSFNVRGNVGAIHATSIELRGAISAKAIESAEFRGLSGAKLNSGWLGSLSAKQMKNSTIVADRIGAMSIKTDMAFSRVHVSPAHDDQTAINSLSVHGTISDSTIFTLGDIGTVTAGAMLKSNLTAGVILLASSTKTPVQPLPNERNGDKLYDFSGRYTIANVTVGGARSIAFSNTIIGADRIGDVKLTGVDGKDTSRAEFGVAGYLVGHVQRSFDRANASKDKEENPQADFTVRQIKEPLHFDPYGGGYYGGAIGSFGAVNIFNGGMGGVGTIRVPTLPAAGLKIGTVDNYDANAVYLTASGGFELRNKTGRMISGSSSLPALIDRLFADANTSIKVERVHGWSSFRTTSVGPVLSLNNENLGGTYYAGSTLPSPGDVGGGGSTSTVARTVPAFDAISKELKHRGNALLVFNQSLLLVKDQPVWMGTVMGVAGTTAIELTQSLALRAGSATGATLAELVASLSADRIGSRRLPARWVASGNGVTIYGLPNGGTAVISNLGQTALNATGATFSIASVKRTRDALLAADIGL